MAARLHNAERTMYIRKKRQSNFTLRPKLLLCFHPKLDVDFCYFLFTFVDRCTADMGVIVGLHVDAIHDSVLARRAARLLRHRRR